MNTSHPLWQLFFARLREFYREPVALFWVYGFPLILAVGLGVAFMNREPQPSPVDVQGPADSSEAQAVAETLRRAGMKAEVHDEMECRQRLRIGKTEMYVVPKSDAGYDYVYDKTRSESVLARHQVDATLLRRRQGEKVDWNPQDLYLTEPGTRYIDFLLPGLIGMNLLGGGMWGVGFSIVDMRVRKLLKRLIATPMRHAHFLLAIFASRLVVMMPEMVLLLCLGWFGFGVPVRGSLWIVILIIFVSASAFSGIGLVIASRTEKTETVSGLMNLVMLPMWMLSGIFFSSKRFPDAMQPFIQALPLTQVNDALREVMLEGAGLADVAWRLGILAAWAIVTFAAALKLFRWK